MNFSEDISAPVSYGTDIRRRTGLDTVPTGQLLDEIRDGRWRREIERVRGGRLPKVKLPYFTPSGTFKRRSSCALVRHSGQVVVDCDDLKPEQIRTVFGVAYDDPFCLAVFESPSGNGLKLLFRVPDGIRTATQHKAIFSQVAQHVRNGYTAKPDMSGSDVSRACFVSSGRIYANPCAEILPVEVPEAGGGNGHRESLCPVGTGNPKEKSLLHLARFHCPFEVKPDGTTYTHLVLRDLSRNISARATRDRTDLTEDRIHQIATVWHQTAQEKGLTTSKSLSEYVGEIKANIRSLRSSDKHQESVDKWIRWTRAKGFPSEGTAAAKILFAIEKHCVDEGSNRFFLSVRDAASVAGINSPTSGGNALRKLVKAKQLKRLPKSNKARDATDFILMPKTKTNLDTCSVSGGLALRHNSSGQVKLCRSPEGWQIKARCSTCSELMIS